MLSFHWIRQFAGRWFPGHPKTHRGRKFRGGRYYSLTLEILEDRQTPAVIIPLASFYGANGANPNGSLIQDANGNLFGTTEKGGEFGYGTVFEVKAGSDAITSLASFDHGGGIYPNGPLVEDSHGNLFGTTPEVDGDTGLTPARATVFELKAGSGSITSLVSFQFGANGPIALVQDIHGNLYGLTSAEAVLGRTHVPSDYTGDALFEVKSASNSLTTLASFDGTTGFPSGLVEDANGNLFGTTSAPDSLFELKAGSNTITTLVSPNGFHSLGGVGMDAHGDLFATTTVGGPEVGSGQVIELKAGSGAFITLASWTFFKPEPVLGTDLDPDIVVDGSGNVFSAGEVNGQTGVVEVKAGRGTITTVASFDGNYGAYPYGRLSVDGNDNIFGTTWWGGPNNDGTVFEIASAASQTVFVQGVYENLLHRAPEPGGLAYWSNLLQSGVAPSRVILDIEQSPEYLTDEVTSLYWQFLHRDPEPGGLQHWVNQLIAGASIEQVTAGILSSPEYFSDPWRSDDTPPGHDPNGTNASFVKSLYRFVLGRPGSTAEVQGWVDALNAGMSRFQVASAFLASQEYGTHLIDSYYSQFLGRSPEASGLASWLQQFQAGTSQDTIQAEIFGSDEGLAKWS